MKKHLLVFFSACILLSTQAYSQNWMQIGEYVLNSTFNEVIEFDDTLYAVGHIWNGQGGMFSKNTPTVWKLVGNTWTQVGSGFAEEYYHTLSTVVVFDDTLYVGGNFDLDNTIDPVFHYVARWDRTNNRWNPVGDGSGSGGGVYELAVFDNKLYAGGDFGELGVAGTNNIAVFNRTSWAAVGGGLSTSTGTGGSPDQVAAMVVYDNELVIGGKFTTADGFSVHNMARWDGSAWDYFMGNSTDGYGGIGISTLTWVSVRALEVFGGNLYIGGKYYKYYSNANDFTASTYNLVKWNGTIFSDPDNTAPSNPQIDAMTVFKDRIYIGSEVQTNIHSWDGSSDWQLEPSLGGSNYVKSFYSNATDIYYAYNSGVYKFADPLPKFSASSTNPCPGEDITFTDESEGTSDATAWNWTFEGGTPATSTEQNPVVSYAANGTYDVSLEVTSTDGTYTLISSDYITVDDVITISIHPSGTTVCSESQASFSASAAFGTGTRQWQVDTGEGFTDLENGGDHYVLGATDGTLKYTPFADQDGIKFRCIFFNCSNSDTTNEATLTVNETPHIVEQSENVALCVEGDTSFEVIASTVSGTITYQWQYRKYGTSTYFDLSDGVVYGGTDTDKLTVTGADNTLAELYDIDNSDGNVSAYYRLQATANGCIKTTTLFLNIHEIPDVLVEPADVAKCNAGSGVNTSFTVTSSVAPSGFKYQWQVDAGSGFVDMVDDTVFTNTNKSNLMVTKASSSYSGNEYRVILGSCSPEVISWAATLTIDDKPVDTLGSSPTVRVCAGTDAEISISPVPGEFTTYQWKNPSTNTDIPASSPYSGTKSATLNITDVKTVLNSTGYLCVMTNGSCVYNSKQFTLYVYDEPTISTQPKDETGCDSGTAVTIRASVSGFQSTVNTYQWQEDFAGSGIYSDLTGTEYTGINTRTLTVSQPVYSMNGYKYRLKIKGCETDIVSDPATLTVKGEPLVIHSPQSQTACLGDKVTLSVKAVGDDLTYKWFADNGDGNGFNQVHSSVDTFYTFSNVQDLYDGRMYKCIVDNGSPCNETAESQVATLSVASATLGTQEIKGGTVHFKGNTITAAVDSFLWTFSDGSPPVGGELNPVHTFTNNGSFAPKLTIFDECGGQKHYYASINITASGFEEFDALARVSIYPNPAKNMLTIENVGLNDRIEVFDIGGRKIHHMKAYSDRTEVDVSDYSRGLYILKITNQKSVREFRFEKQ